MSKIKKFIKRNVTNVNIAIGKKLYGNTIGLQKNIAGRTNMLITNAKSDYNKSKTTDSSITELKQKGFLVIKCPYEQSLIHEIRNKYNEKIMNDEYSHINSQYEDQVFSRSSYRAHKNFPELSKLLTKEVIKIVEEWYQGYFRVKHVTFWKNYHVPPELATKDLLSSNWHCDFDKPDLYRMLVYLSEVDEDCGPFHIQSQQRTKELVKMGFGNRSNYQISTEILEDPNHVVKCTGPAGSIVLCNNSLCLHRAGIPGVGKVRDIVQFLFVPSNKPLPENWIDNIEDDPQEDISRKKFAK